MSNVRAASLTVQEPSGTQTQRLLSLLSSPLTIVVAAAVLLLFVPPLGDFPIEDDWLYARAVQGLIGAESLVCSRIAAFSPSVSDRQPQWRSTGATDGDRR